MLYPHHHYAFKMHSIRFEHSTKRNDRMCVCVRAHNGSGTPSFRGCIFLCFTKGSSNSLSQQQQHAHTQCVYTQAHVCIHSLSLCVHCVFAFTVYSKRTLFQLMSVLFMCVSVHITHEAKTCVTYTYIHIHINNIHQAQFIFKFVSTREGSSVAVEREEEKRVHV